MIIRDWRRTAIAASLMGALALLSGGASAAECPADKRVASGHGQKPGATAPKDVTDTVLASIDLAKESVGVKERKFRLRRLIVQPGGIVPWHSHDDRPAIIYIVEGEITEFSSTCAVPIVHKAGEVAPPEVKGTAHWWQNTGSRTAVLLSADLLRDNDDKHVM